MSDWYKDETVNLEYEKQMQERYSDYKLSAKIWQERAERMKALAAKRKELLRRVAKLVDPVAHELGECEDCDLMREVIKELGDEN